jgi:hypothetical protein
MFTTYLTKWILVVIEAGIHPVCTCHRFICSSHLVILHSFSDLCHLIVLLQVHQKEIKAEKGSLLMSPPTMKEEMQSAIGAPPGSPPF